MDHFIRLIIGLMTIAVVVFIVSVVYNLVVNLGIWFFVAISVLMFAYWIGYEIFDI